MMQQPSMMQVLFKMADSFNWLNLPRPKMVQAPKPRGTNRAELRRKAKEQQRIKAEEKR